MPSQLRSAVAPEDDRHSERHDLAVLGLMLQSTVALKNDRHTPCTCFQRHTSLVAIHGRPGGQPSLLGARRVREFNIESRFSAASEDDRHQGVHLRTRQTAEVAILGRSGGRPPPAGRTPRNLRCAERCDPRSPRRATAAPSGDGCVNRGAEVAIHGPLGRHPPRHSQPFRIVCRSIAILGCPGGRLPRHPRRHHPQPPQGSDPWPLRRATATWRPPRQARTGAEVAILGRPAGRSPPLGELGQCLGVVAVAIHGCP